ncbi:SIS domain-containing protein [Paenibacillus sp. P25]|nr:SIS domain-containing protein [Paenibacillus sp. P25]
MLNFDEQKYLQVVNGAVSLRNQIECAVDEASERGFKNLFLLGSGGAIASMYAYEYLINTHSSLPVYAEIAAEFSLMHHKQFGKDSLVILSSLSGTTQETVEAAKYCKQIGAVTIGLTGEAGTPLAELVDYPLINYAENDFASDSVNIQLLYLTFRLLNKRGEFPEYEAFADQLDRMPSVLLQVKEAAEKKAEQFALKYKDETYHMVVGAGSLWGRAYSYAMCVLEEMQWIRTKSIHAAEFFHGTLEVVDEETSILLLKGEDETRPLADRVQRFAERYTRKLTVFDTADYELDGISPAFRKPLSPLVTASALQRVSVHLEDKRKHSLEHRRYYRVVEY